VIIIIVEISGMVGDGVGSGEFVGCGVDVGCLIDSVPWVLNSIQNCISTFDPQFIVFLEKASKRGKKAMSTSNVLEGWRS